MTAREAIENALKNLSLKSQEANSDYPYDRLALSNALPVVQLTERGFHVQIIEADNADILPHLLVENGNGQVEIERCPFDKLALVSHDSAWQGLEVKDILQKAGITPLTIEAFDGFPNWHGVPVIAWLFPQRLSEALSLFDALREHSS